MEKRKEKNFKWLAVIGWIIAIICIGIIGWLLKQNNDLSQDIQTFTEENTNLKKEKVVSETQLAEINTTMDIIRSKNYQIYTLVGNQAVSPDAFSKIFLNKKEKVLYVDIKGLPTPPQEKTYQLWAFMLDPLTPTNIGIIDSKTNTGNYLYRFSEVPESESFGITLEPVGGNQFPTLSQLYALGMVPTDKTN